MLIFYYFIVKLMIETFTNEKVTPHSCSCCPFLESVIYFVVQQRAVVEVNGQQSELQEIM